MKTIGKLLAATTIALAAVSGSATSVASAVPWYAWTGYYTNGVLTGEIFYFCDGRIRERGNLTMWDEQVEEYYHACP